MALTFNWPTEILPPTLNQLYRNSLFWISYHLNDLILPRCPRSVTLTGTYSLNWPKITPPGSNLDSWQDDLAYLELMDTDDEWKINYSWWIWWYCISKKSAQNSWQHLPRPSLTYKRRGGQILIFCFHHNLMCSSANIFHPQQEATFIATSFEAHY